MTEKTAKGDCLRILMIGDIVGKPGRDVAVKNMPAIREKHEIDFVVANAENVSGGSGITPDIFNSLAAAGIDCVTLGDHALRVRSIYPVLNSDPRIIRPGNYPSEAPGKGWTVLEAPATPTRPAARIGVFTLLGRVFMQQPVDNPLTCADRILEKLADVRIKLLDFHAEATSESQIMGRYLDGKVSAVLGTHTHVATADETIFPGGTAYQTDVGMTGSFDSIIGRKIEPVLDNFRTCRQNAYDVASENPGISGTIVDVAPATGKAVAIRRFVFRENESAPAPPKPAAPRRLLM